MEVNKKQLADIFGASIRTIQNWQEQGMPVLRGGGKGNEVLYDSAAVIRWYAERDAEIENEKLRREVEELRQMSRNLSLIRCFCVSFSVRAIPSLRRKSISHKFRDW